MIGRISLLAAILAVVANGAMAEDHKPHWAYEGEMGPEHWAQIEGTACSGSHQSPVNIIRTDSMPKADTVLPLTLHYSPETEIFDVVNNGHSIQFDFAKGDEVEYLGNRFALKQIHFHEPSEHTLNGVRYPIEMHMVHVNESLNQYTVLSVLGYEGKPAPGYDELEAVLPLKVGEKKAINKAFDLADILPFNLTPRFHYQGSLTTPPCTENVNWVVFEQPFMMSEAQVKMLKDNMPANNYRGVQPLNDRGVSLVVH